MLGVAAIWVGVMLLTGGFILDRTVRSIIASNFDDQLESSLDTMIGSAELSDEGEVRFDPQLSDQRYLQVYSGYYWQICQEGNAIPRYFFRR